MKIKESLYQLYFKEALILEWGPRTIENEQITFWIDISMVSSTAQTTNLRTNLVFTNISQLKKRRNFLLVQKYFFFSVEKSIPCSWHQTNNSPIYEKNLTKNLLFFCFLLNFCIEIKRPFLNLEGASKCISQHH